MTQDTSAINDPALDAEASEEIPMSDNPAEATSTHEVQIGIQDDADFDELLDHLPTDVADLPEGNLDGETGYDGTILGMRFDKGGELRTPDPAKNQKFEPFTTRPQVLLTIRVDNKDDLGYPFDTVDIPLPVPEKKPTASKAPDPTKNSKYGLFLESLAYLGVTGDVGTASTYLLDDKRKIRDILGMMCHFQNRAFETFRNRTTNLHVPTEIYGFDNALRVDKQGFPPAFLVDDHSPEAEENRAVVAQAAPAASRARRTA